MYDIHLYSKKTGGIRGWKDSTLPCCLSTGENHLLGGEREGCNMIRKGIKTASKAAFRITTERRKNYILRY